mmetsp:Transcript_13614/g.34245  ORF Transcript_13614/g.34245 Transcript_13614/m.34245 type:complete len:256 (+) Transcript_13614:83-850(+)
MADVSAAQGPAIAAEDAIRKFYEAGNTTRYIADVMSFGDYKTDTKQAVTVDLLEQALKFSKQSGLSLEQTSAFLKLCLEAVQSVTAGHAVRETEGSARELVKAMCSSVPNFGPSVVKVVLDFMARTIFQHYNLYSYVFTKGRVLDEVDIKLEVETPRIPPLDKATLHVEPEPEPSDDEAENADADVEGGADSSNNNEGSAEDDQAGDGSECEDNPLNDLINEEIEQRIQQLKEKLSKEYEEREEQLLQKISQLEK